MNTWALKLIATVILVMSAVYSYAKFGPGLPISSVITQKNELFTVTGEGKVTVVPDTAIVNLGIQVEQANVKSAQSQANAVINKMISDLKSLGIKDKDIKTSNYSIYPRYDKPNSYQVNVSVSVTVRDLDKINQVIDTATADGANSVGGVQLTVDEDKQKELLNQARSLAIKEAKTKAESLAQAAGMTLGKIINIQEGSNNPRPIYALEMMKADSATNIQPGSTDVTSSITLSYETR